MIPLGSPPAHSPLPFPAVCVCVCVSPPPLSPRALPCLLSPSLNSLLSPSHLSLPPLLSRPPPFPPLSAIKLLTAIFKLRPRGFWGSAAPPTPRSPLARTGGDYIFCGIFFPLFIFLGFVLGVYRLWEVALRFSHEISGRMHSNSCLETPWGREHEHICKNIYLFTEIVRDYNHSGKEY